MKRATNRVSVSFAAYPTAKTNLSLQARGREDVLSYWGVALPLSHSPSLISSLPNRELDDLFAFEL